MTNNTKGTPQAATTASAPQYENVTDHNGKLIGVRMTNADQMPSYAATTASASGETSGWRVGEFWSSANPDKKVLMLAEGTKEIYSYGKHPDFIRWVDGRGAAPQGVDERVLFEQWLGRPMMNPEKPSHYNGRDVCTAWGAWQARATLVQHSAPRPAATDAEGSQQARKAVFAAYSRCLADDSLSPDAIADILLSATHHSATDAKRDRPPIEPGPWADYLKEQAEVSDGELPPLPKGFAFAVESNIGNGMRAITKLTLDETEADRYANRDDMARIGCGRKKIELYTAEQYRQGQREAYELGRRAGSTAGVPDGYRLVPVEPTPEMIAAMQFRGDIDIAIGHAQFYKEAVDDYAAMLAAAHSSKSSPAGEQGEQKPGPLNGIPATMRHDEGAISQCFYCGRYSLDPKTLSDRQPVCECGKQHGWSGSFKRPGADAKWSGKGPAGEAQ
jgi:hypothetical protein